jgi:hypothetical protein
MKRQTKHIESDKKLNDYQRFFKALSTNINWVNSLLTILFIGTLYLTVFEIHIYRKTLIHWAVPTSIWFLTGLILTPLTNNFLKKHYDTSGFFLQLVFNVVTWGGLLLYGLMATNYYFPSDGSKLLSTKIINKGNLSKGRGGGCAEPYCDVIIDKTEKQLFFSCGIDIENFDYIDLTIKKGLWGFDIITDKIPTNEKKNAL